MDEVLEIQRLSHPEKEVVVCVQTPGVCLEVVLSDWLWELAHLVIRRAGWWVRNMGANGPVVS